MRLNDLKPAEGSKKNRRRVGRFEGGQMPLHRRLPKRGFTSITRGLTAEVRLDELQKMPVTDIDLTALKLAGVIRRDALGAKVILSGKLDKKVSLKGIKVTKGARAAIEAAGGSIEIVEAQPAA